MEVEPIPTKQTTRRDAGVRRARIIPAEKRAWSSRIFQQVSSLPEFQRAESLALYADRPDEVGTAELFTAAAAAGKLVFYPRVDIDSRSLHFFHVTDLHQLQPGYRGILEPPTGSEEMTTPFDLIIVPGLAFDCRGRRLGRGGGHYDAWLAHVDGWRLGLAYDCQLVPEIPVEGHDQLVDIIITEMRMIRCQRG